MAKMTKQEVTEAVSQLIEQANSFIEAARKLSEDNGVAFYYDGYEFNVGQEEQCWCGSSC